MQVLELFKITYDSDTVEGKGHTITLSYADSSDVAKSIVEDKRFARYCVMGIQNPSDYIYKVHKEIIKIFNNPDDFFSNTRDAIKERALSKLTAEEREALGI